VIGPKHQVKIAASLMAVAAGAAALMFLFELTKQIVYPRIAIWASHTVTICFTTLLAVFAAYIVGRRLATLNAELAADIEERKRLELLQKQSEVELRASEASFRSLVENAPFGICRSAPTEDRFLNANPALARILGFPSEHELLSLRLSQDVYLRPQDRRALLDAVAKSSPFEVVTDWKRSDGTPIKVRITGRRVAEEPGGDDPFECIVEEVTDRLVLEDRLRQAQKMEAIGRLAGGVAHDFNNLLGVIMGHAELIASYGDSDPRALRRAMAIREVTQHAAALTGQLLAFGRRQMLQVTAFNLNEVITTTSEMLQRLIGEDVNLQMHLSPDLGSVSADRVQMQQVILNLASNARDAMPQGGILTIETVNVELDASYAMRHEEASAGSWVLMAVSDTGTGMDAETQSRIFEPFFTTKNYGHGTGLGMASVYGIVKQCGGLIYVYSELGSGTTFKVYLPRLIKPVGPTAAQGPPQQILRGSETILVVEDAPEMREVTRDFLTTYGYNVLDAGSAAEAVAIMDQRPAPIDLLITDVVMPGESGPKLAARLALKQPGLKVLYVSGYTANAIVHHGLVDPGIAFLQKPFLRDVLGQKVREVLGGDAS
jgi:two-component system, cell cycle sensor histidine kinase and response regulator CckA